jgi:hypothetical protein
METNPTPIQSTDAGAASMPCSAAVECGTPGAIPRAAGRPVERPARRRRWAIILGCVLVLAAVPVGYYFYQKWATGRELDAVIARIDADDPRWRIEEILADRQAIADADNPALVAARADILLRGAGNLDLLGGEKNWRLFDKMTSVRQLHPLQIEVLRPALEQRADAVKLARTLKEFPGEGRFAIKLSPDYLSTNLDPLQRCRNVMNLLQYDAMLRAEDGDAAGAMESCRALLVTARAIGDEPYLIAALIRFAGQFISISALERTLAQGEPPARELEAMQELLASEIEVPLLAKAIRGERGGFDQLLVMLDKGHVKASSVFGAFGPGGSRNTWEAWFLDHIPIVLTQGRADHLELMTQAVEAARLPAEKQKGAFARVEKAHKESSSLVVRLLMPALTKVSDANQRSQACLRCALVGVAAERYRIRNNQWPATLGKLVDDGLLKAIPVDPYDGQPLRYKLRPDGAVVYSIGHDGVDNGGNINRERPLDSGVDLGFELWNVSVRRQPPQLPHPEED